MTVNDSLEKSEPITGNSSTSTKLLSVPYVLVLVEIALISLTMTLFMPLLPIYIKTIGGNLSLAGLAVSVFTFASLIGRPFFAVLIDKVGRKPFLIVGMVLILAACFGYQFVGLIGVLLLIRVVHGLGYGASSNTTGTMVADIVPKARIGQGIGYYGFVTVAALALGPATGLLIMKNADIKTAFAVASIGAAVALVVSFFISYERKSAVQQSTDRTAVHSAHMADHGRAKRSLGYERTALPASLVMLFVAIGYSGIVAFLPTYAGTLGLGDISVFFVLYAIVLLATRIVVDRITKRRDISVVLLPGIVLMTIAFILLGAGKTLPIFLVAAVVFGIGYGSVQPTLNAIVVSLCPPTRRGAANSTFFSAMDLGIGLGALIWGFVSQAFGFATLYYASVICMIAAGSFVVGLRIRSNRQASHAS